MKIIKTEEISGMTVNTYDNGVIEKYLTGSKVENPKIEEPEQSTQLDRIEEQVYSNNENNIILMEAMADQYEQTEQYRINDMEVQATIFETVLALGEGGTTV